MTAATVHRLADVDARLTALAHCLEGARAAHRHSPNPDTARAVRALLAACDRLLDQRLTLHPPPREEPRP